jgi:hypothetical protein
MAGLSPATGVAALRVEGTDRPGLGAKMTGAIADAGINLRGSQKLEIPKNPSIELPPHFEEVAYGLYACERGWVLYQGRCVTDTEVPHGPVVDISSLRSAGDGAPGTCPSGGCGARYVRTRPRAPARHGFGRRHGCVGVCFRGAAGEGSPFSVRLGGIEAQSRAASGEMERLHLLFRRIHSSCACLTRANAL